MHRLVFLSLLALLIGCNDSTPLDSPVGPELTVIAAADRAMRTQFAVQSAPDPACSECAPFGERLTPSFVGHYSGGTNGFLVTGELEGRALISGGTNSANINLRNGKGSGSGTLHLELTKPKVGAFDCHWHAKWEGYGPPSWAFVEYAKWFNCKGSGQFQGMQMVLWNDNAANPGVPLASGIAEMW